MASMPAVVYWFNESVTYRFVTPPPPASMKLPMPSYA